jgi:uncharacterized protein (TIGR02598 family)
MISKRLHRHQQGAFSLIEILVAMGITSLLVTALIGLIPGSLDQLHHSASMTAEARIVQAVHAKYQMLSWSDVLNQQQGQATVVLRFDAQGIPLEVGDTNSIFVAQVSVNPAPPLPGTTFINDHMRQLIILVSDQPGAGDKLLTTAQAKQHQALIAQTDKQL